jgi:DNA repair photolyase
MAATLTADVMNGKPVYTVPAKSVLNMTSGFRHKLLCDGPTFTAGTSCSFSCGYCYVEDLMRKSPHVEGLDRPFEDVVIRREGAIDALRRQLTHGNSGKPKYLDPADQRVLYMSPLVDVAGNVILRDETIEACKLILSLTHWQIRMLSKSNMLPSIAAALAPWNSRERMIFGVSTGTLDDGLAKSFELGTALVSRRIESLRWLQDHYYRTFGMICPSLPLADADSYALFASEMYAAIRGDRCEHVWAEVMNVRGESLVKTVHSLRAGGFDDEAELLQHVSEDQAAWEGYARATFEAHAPLYRSGQLRFLQYVNAKNRTWWETRIEQGAVLL